jgi:simple sugar transport system substrate-binding protein
LDLFTAFSHEGTYTITYIITFSANAPKISSTECCFKNTVDRLIKTDDDSLYVGFVGSDFYQEGKNAGLFLKKKTADMDKVRIVEIAGTLDSSPMRQRGKGFRDVLGDDPKYQILESISGDFLRSMGKECMIHLLDTYDKIDVLYSHNDAMTLGAIEAIEAKGLKPGKDIIIITVDGEQKAIDLLKEGKINCVVECTPMLGDMVMTLTKKLAAGETIDRITYSNERVFSEYDKNLDFLPERGY